MSYYVVNGVVVPVDSATKEEVRNLSKDTQS